MSARVTALSAPAGSGKTVLLGSWISQEGLGERVAWVRHGQAAGDWASAGRLLADHWPGLQLNGQAATVHALLARFPAEVRAADPELAVLAAADQLAAGSLAEAGRLLELAERGTKSVPPDGGEAAPGAGHHAGAADRPAVPGVHRPGSPHVGRQRAVIALRGGGGARPGDDRAGPAARLGPRARRGHCLHRATERLSMLLHAPDWPLTRTRALRLHALVRLGETRRAEQDIADLSQQARASGEIHVAVAAPRIGQGDPRAAAVELAPVLSGAASVPPTTWLAHAYVLAAIARDALGDPSAAADADQLVGGGDRRRTDRVGDHRPHAHPPPVPQARRAPSHRGRPAGPRPRPARAVARTPGKRLADAVFCHQDTMRRPSAKTNLTRAVMPWRRAARRH
jgi:hypothetical protein